MHAIILKMLVIEYLMVSYSKSKMQRILGIIFLSWTILLFLDNQVSFISASGENKLIL